MAPIIKYWYGDGHWPQHDRRLQFTKMIMSTKEVHMTQIAAVLQIETAHVISIHSTETYQW